MITVKVSKIGCGIILPLGNPFPLYNRFTVSGSNRSDQIRSVRTGLKIEIPDGFDIRIKPVMQWLVPVGYNFTKGGEDDGELCLLMAEFLSSGSCIGGHTHIADLEIVHSETARARFVEFTPSGKRIVKGEPAEVKPVDENSSSIQPTES